MPIPGPFELLILFVVVLLVFGVGKLPEVGAALGKGIRDFRKGLSEDDEKRASKSDHGPL
ncbi:MAG: twin-arginine translocation protein, TatA/E family subunit [Dehalococcoidia bacterium]|nr:twin-arginine translocation protein, TatA/E family subunit [Dehalococcoidia bacterium]